MASIRWNLTAFHNLQWLHFTGVVDTFLSSEVTFLLDLLYQKLLKSFNCWVSYFRKSTWPLFGPPCTFSGAPYSAGRPSRWAFAHILVHSVITCHLYTTEKPHLFYALRTRSWRRHCTLYSNREIDLALEMFLTKISVIVPFTRSRLSIDIGRPVYQSVCISVGLVQ